MLVAILRQHRGLPQASIRLSVSMSWLRFTIVAAVALAPLLVSTSGAASEVARPVPPPLPFAVADAEATVAVVAQSDGRVAAVELSSGQIRWRSPQGRWRSA